MQPKKGLVPESIVAYYGDGKLICQFSRQKAVTSRAELHVASEYSDSPPSEVADLSNAYYLFLGKGPGSGGKSLTLQFRNRSFLCVPKSVA